MQVLVINCGSSSVKSRTYTLPDKRLIAQGVVDRIAEESSQLTWRCDGRTHRRDVKVEDHDRATRLLLRMLLNEGPAVAAEAATIEAVGHRVVHGGDEVRDVVRIDEACISLIERFEPLAPLHNPVGLAGVRAAMEVLPDVPHVACFDTTFHRTMPEMACTYALPLEFQAKYGIRRYGFHGISHRYAVERAARMLGREPQRLNAITCHLGNGCSVSAIRQGRSVDTSMGMTPLEGLVMGTRGGDMDPGVLLYLAQRGVPPETLDDICRRRSGLLGLSGVSSDMRDVLQSARQGNRNADLAVDIFCYRLKKYIGAYLAAIGRLDALVFTGGIGENAPEIRARTCMGLDALRIEIDKRKNRAAVGVEADVAPDANVMRVLVIPANEELAIADEVYRWMQQGRR